MHGKLLFFCIVSFIFLCAATQIWCLARLLPLIVARVHNKEGRVSNSPMYAYCMSA